MVGFAINFECLCGSIKFPTVVYREYEIGGKNRVMGGFQVPTQGSGNKGKKLPSWYKNLCRG